MDVLLLATDLLKPLLMNPGTVVRLSLAELLDPYLQRLPFKLRYFFKTIFPKLTERQNIE